MKYVASRMAPFLSLAWGLLALGCSRTGGGIEDGGFQEAAMDRPSGRCGDGVCDPGESVESCPEDCEGCGGVPEVGCCAGSELLVCRNGSLFRVDCGADGCGWSGERYGCGGSGEEPTGRHPRDCGCGWERFSATSHVYRGTLEPTVVCLTEGQQLAVGALLEDMGDGSFVNFCTGTLVAPKVVLTAAHCVGWEWGGGLRDPATLRFAVGRDVAEASAVFEVEALAQHPGYDYEAPHDVGLVFLKVSAVEELPELEPVPVNDQPLPADFVGSYVQNVGYGATEVDEDNTVRFWTAEVVTGLAEGEFVVYGQGWSSVCYGDSGGPSFYHFGDGRLALVGTVSWGEDSCVGYDHFARADANWDFLAGFLEDYDPCFGLDETGRCVGDIAQFCQGGRLVQQCCSVCGETADGRYRCLSEDPCGVLGTEGRCIGDRLEWCESGRIRQKTCGACGAGHCAFRPETGVYDCVEN